MVFPNTEFARRAVIRALTLNTEVVVVEDDDPTNSDPDPDKFRVTAPDVLSERSLLGVGLTNQQMVEVFRADLKNQLPLIDAEIRAVKLSKDTNIGLLRDFCTAALDLKQ